MAIGSSKYLKPGFHRPPRFICRLYLVRGLLGGYQCGGWGGTDSATDSYCTTNRAQKVALTMLSVMVTGVPFTHFTLDVHDKSGIMPFHCD